MLKQFNNTELERLFDEKTTENGDPAFSSTGNKLVDILFLTEYYSNHLDRVKLGDSPIEKLFAMFIRDPRFGLGYRDLGRVLMSLAKVTPENIALAGRFDDLYLMPNPSKENLEYLIKECNKNNSLAKKWMPRYSSKHIEWAIHFAHMLNMNKQQYGHFVKTDTVENTMSRQRWEAIEFEYVPSLASIKYVNAFQRHEPERYAKYLEDVRSGKKQLHVATTTVYDIYRNRKTIDADLFYSKIEKINISCIPIIDVSGSMYDDNDSIGKALSIGKYLSDCSTYCNGQFLTFSIQPQLVTQCGETYVDIINNVQRADWGGSTDFAAVMHILKGLQEELPEYIIVLSDMQFNYGGRQSKDELMNSWRQRGIKTKIIWWNFNSRNTYTMPETDSFGNIFMGGYSPMLLKYLEVGFDAQQFLQKLLEEYSKQISNQFPSTRVH